MIVWLVNFPKGCGELNCAWTKKEDALNYLHEEMNFYGWELVEEKSNKENPYSYMIFTFACDDNEFEVLIGPLFVDEKPYL